MTTNLDIPWLALVTRADPDFPRAKRRDVEYEMSSGRKFMADPTDRGAYFHRFAAFDARAFQANAVQVR